MVASNHTYAQGNAVQRVLKGAAVLGLRGLIIFVLGSIALMTRVRPGAFLFKARD